jgi:hypothetical protein
MAPRASAVPVRPASEAEDLIAAANAVFGALELIGETHCSEETAQNVIEATVAANARLQDLGLVREDLRDRQIRCQPRPHERDLGPGSAMVVDITSRPADRKQSR